MYDCTVDKLVLSNHLYEMHPLLSEVFQTLWDVKNLGEAIHNYILLTGSNKVRPKLTLVAARPIARRGSRGFERTPL